jgi:peptide/nickel transport system permease protein
MIINLTPGDATTILLPKDATPAQYERLREELGLNDPLIEQYGRYMLNMIRGSLGVSWYTNESVLGSFAERLPATALLAIGTLFVATLLAVPLGVYASLHPHSALDRVFATASFVGVSMPGFWLGLLLIIVFAANLRWLPSGGSGSPAHLILPSIMLGTNHSAEIMRMTRASMLDVVNSDFVRMARSKGINEPAVIYHHALRNAIIPVITIMGHQFANGLGGSVITETVFSWPGVGRLLIEAINRQDRPMIMGCMIMITAIICICNLFVDILYAFVDPRIKAEYNKR